MTSSQQFFPPPHGTPIQDRTRAHSAAYRFGDRCLQTRFEFTTLSPCSEPLPEGAIRIALTDPAVASDEPGEWLHHWRDSNAVIQLSLARLTTGYRLRFPELCDFLIDPDGARIDVMPPPGLDADTLEHLLVDQVLPRYLAHTGDLTLHASAVRVNNDAALFLGESGWGKSTLAGFLRRAGCNLLSDDCVILRPARGRAIAISTYPSLRLFDDSVGAMALPGTTSPVASYTDKRRLPVPEDGYDRIAGVPVAAIYLLADPQIETGGGHSIMPLSPMMACVSLIQHSFQLDVLDRTRCAARLAQAGTATRLTPAFLLRYPRDYASADQLTGTLLSHLDSLTGQASDHAFK